MYTYKIYAGFQSDDHHLKPRGFQGMLNRLYRYINRFKGSNTGISNCFWTENREIWSFLWWRNVYCILPKPCSRPFFRKSWFTAWECKNVLIVLGLVAIWTFFLTIKKVLFSLAWHTRLAPHPLSCPATKKRTFFVASTRNPVSLLQESKYYHSICDFYFHCSTLSMLKQGKTFQRSVYLAK